MGENFSLNCFNPELYPCLAQRENEINSKNNNGKNYDEYSNIPLKERNSEYNGAPSENGQFINDGNNISVDSFFSQNYYNKLCQNNIQKEFIQPLESFSIFNLVNYIVSFYKTTIGLITTAQTESMIAIYKLKLAIYFDYDVRVNSDKGNKLDKQEFYKAIMNLAEIYHFCKYWLSGQRGAYSNFYWNKKGDLDEYFFKKIEETRQILYKVLE